MFTIHEYTVNSKHMELVACFNDIEELPSILKNIHNAMRELDGDQYGPSSKMVSIDIDNYEAIFDLDSDSYDLVYIVREMPEAPFLNILECIPIHSAHAITFDIQF